MMTPCSAAQVAAPLHAALLAAAQPDAAFELQAPPCTLCIILPAL